MRLPAAQPIVDAPPITKVELKLGAVPPDRLLDKARKVRGIAWIEFPGVDETRYLAQHIRTTAIEIAGGAIRVLGCEVSQDACSVKEIMNQRIDDDHLRSYGAPSRPGGRTGQEQPGEGEGDVAPAV